MDPSRIVFILYKPAVPGNIGAAARAMKTMGFSELRLIDPADHLADEARMLAHASNEILENASVFSDVESAVYDLDFIVSTTAKSKSGKVDYLSSGELRPFLEDKLVHSGRIGIVFGSEESGLPNSVLLNSNIGVTIPMAVEYPSLNLAQSVMIIAYELSGIQPSGKENADDSQPEISWKELQDKATVLLEEAGISHGTPLFHRIIERMSLLKASDARLAHSITSKLAARTKTGLK